MNRLRIRLLPTVLQRIFRQGWFKRIRAIPAQVTAFAICLNIPECHHHKNYIRTHRKSQLIWRNGIIYATLQLT